MDIFEFWFCAKLKNKTPPPDRFIKSGNKVANACLTRWRTASWLTAAVLQCNIEHRDSVILSIEVLLARSHNYHKLDKPRCWKNECQSPYLKTEKCFL